MAKLTMKGLATHTPRSRQHPLCPRRYQKSGGEAGRGRQPWQSRRPCRGLDRPAYAWGLSPTPGPSTAKAQSHSGQPSQGWTCVQLHVSSGAMPTLSFCKEPDSPIKVHGGGGNFPGSSVVKTQPSSAEDREFDSWSGT